MPLHDLAAAFETLFNPSPLPFAGERLLSPHVFPPSLPTQSYCCRRRRSPPNPYSMNSSPYTSEILNQILEAKGELSERTAQPLLVRALRTLERSRNGRAQLRERCEATWNACYPYRRKWAEIGEGAQAEWLRVFEVFDSLSTPNAGSVAPPPEPR